MSDAKTMRDVVGPGREDLDGAYCVELDDSILDYHIIPGATAVVTPGGLEAMARRYVEEAGLVKDWDALLDGAKQFYMMGCTLILEAAGIRVAKEVVVVGGEGIGVPVVYDNNQPPLYFLHAGDTIAKLEEE